MTAYLIAFFVVLFFIFLPIFIPLKFRCWFSARFFDIHDYHVDCGGDGIPQHFHTYKCWNCGKEFKI